jgi:DNA processing protein
MTDVFSDGGHLFLSTLGSINHEKYLSLVGDQRILVFLLYMEPSYTVIEQKDFSSNPLLSRLLELHDIPERIYLHGTLPTVTSDEYGRLTPRILTVVGSRKNTTYGRQALEMLLASLKGYDVIILSGLALGIDGLAHKQALTSNIVTLAIPGSGLDPSVLYPSSHNTLAKDIIGYDGALISELSLTTPAAPWTFPKRNRIMAALCDALLVIEAEEKSGTLITARLALELGRDIGAVPGELFSPTAQGTNTLIREGAYLISSQKDLLSLLHLSPHEDSKDARTTSTPFTEIELKLLELLREPTDKDTLLEQSGLPFDIFLTTFSSLEINGHLEETFGEVRRLV